MGHECEERWVELWHLMALSDNELFQHPEDQRKSVHVGREI